MLQSLRHIEKRTNTRQDTYIAIRSRPKPGAWLGLEVFSLVHSSLPGWGRQLARYHFGRKASVFGNTSPYECQVFLLSVYSHSSHHDFGGKIGWFQFTPVTFFGNWNILQPWNHHRMEADGTRTRDLSAPGRALDAAPTGCGLLLRPWGAWSGTTAVPVCNRCVDIVLWCCMMLYVCTSSCMHSLNHYYTFVTFFLCTYVHSASFINVLHFEVSHFWTL